MKIIKLHVLSLLFVGSFNVLGTECKIKNKDLIYEVTSSIFNQNLKKILPVDTQCVSSNDFILELNDEGKRCQNTQTITQLEEEKSGEKSSVVGDSFSLPKDFVASTIKGFENQKSPEKGDDSSIVVKRTGRTRKNKQSNDESQACEPQINGSHTENTQNYLRLLST
jgi:hypothetical protein